MKPLMPPINTPDNLFHDGNPTTGVEGTIVPAEHLNNEQGSIRDVQSELIAILTAAKMAPDSTVGQLLAALNKLYAPGNDTLGALASLVGAANKLPYFTGPKGAALTDLTAFARTLLSRSDPAGVLSDLGLVEALKNKQPLDASLTSLSSLAGAHNKFPYFNSPDSFVLGDITDIGKGIISCLTVEAVYLYLGIKTAALKNVGTGPGQIPDMGSQSVTLTNGGGVQYFSNGVIRQWGLTSPIGGSGGSVDVTFPVPFPNQVQQVRLFDAGNPVASVNFCMAGVTTKDGVKVWGVASISATGPTISPLQAGKGSLWEAWGN